MRILILSLFTLFSTQIIAQADFEKKLQTKLIMAEDGDMVKIYINSMVVVARAQLINNFRTVEIGLTPGFNKIDFEAINQGSSGPNTAEFKVYDDKGALISASQWNLGTGFKATIILVKE